jgi:hypothetical protein
MLNAAEQRHEYELRNNLRKHGFMLKRNYGKDTFTIYAGEYVRGGGSLDDVAKFVNGLTASIHSSGSAG